MVDLTIEKLQKLDTACLSDALDSLGINGGLEGIIPRLSNLQLCGRAFTVEYGIPLEEEKVDAKAADFIDEVQCGDVVILANNGRTDCTIWGGILTTLACQKKLGGTVVDGACRDLNEIQRNHYPLFSKAVYMKTGKGRTKKRNHQVPVRIGDIDILPGDYVRGDGNGVIIIPQGIVQEVIERAENIRYTEGNIITAISQGMRLDEARKKYKYHKPWEN